MGDGSASPHRDAHNTRCSETGERKKNTTLYATLENCTTSAERERVCLVLSHVRSRSIPSMSGAVRAAAACSLYDISATERRLSVLCATQPRHWLANSVIALPLASTARAKFERWFFQLVIAMTLLCQIITHYDNNVWYWNILSTQIFGWSGELN